MPKKRANGEGSLRKRKDGRWEGRYTAGNDPTTGKPIHKSVLAKTQSEAKEKLKQAIAEAEKLDMSRAKSYTLGAWIKLWYEVYAEPRLREKTKDYYLNYIDNHIIPELGNTPLEKLTTIQIQKFYNDLQKSGRIQRYTHIKLKNKGLSTRVVRGIHTLLNNCLEQAVAERLILTNPAKGCRLPKLEKREMKILPEDKIGPYLAEAERRGVHQISRPQTHLRHAVPQVRRGRQDAVRCFPDLSAFGSRFGSCEKRQNAASLFENINAKKFLISYEIRNFLVETAGLEPVTSCV